MIWCLVAGLLVTLALLPLGIRFSYRENRGQLRLKIGPVVWPVYPKREKSQQTELPEQAEKTQEQGEETSSEAAPKSVPSPQSPTQKTSLRAYLPPEQAEKTQEQGEETSSEAAPKSVPSPQSPTQKTSLRAYLPLLRLGLNLMGDLRRKIRMDRLEFHLLLAGGDPCDLAVNYGRTWAAVGALLPQLERLFVIRKRDVQVQCDFAGTRSSVTAGVDVTITLGRLLALLAVYGVRGLKEYRTLKGKCGAEHESETSQHAGNNHSENP